MAAEALARSTTPYAEAPGPAPVGPATVRALARRPRIGIAANVGGWVKTPFNHTDGPHNDCEYWLELGQVMKRIKAECRARGVRPVSEAELAAERKARLVVAVLALLGASMLFGALWLFG